MRAFPMGFRFWAMHWESSNVDGSPCCMWPNSAHLHTLIMGERGFAIEMQIERQVFPNPCMS